MEPWLEFRHLVQGIDRAIVRSSPAKGDGRTTAGAAAARRQGVGGGRVGQVHAASGPYMQLAGKCIAGGDAGREAARERKTEGERKGHGRRRRVHAQSRHMGQCRDTPVHCLARVTY